MAKFLILSAKKDGDVSIYIHIQRRKSLEHKALSININTLMHTDAKKWRDAQGDTIKYDRFRRDNKTLFAKLDEIRDAIDDLIDKGVYDKPSIDKVVADIAYKELREQQEIEKQKQEQERIKHEQERQAARLNVVNLYDEFFAGIVNGDIKHGSDETYSTGSIQIWRQFGKYLKDFCKDKHITFETIDHSVADGFSKFLEHDRGLMAKSVTKNIICFRRLCNYAAEAGVNRNAVSLKVWKERKVKDEQKRVATYLNADELNALYRLPLQGDRERVRDMFVFGTLLCQRFSDYMNLYKDNFKKVLEDGTECCRLTQRKTGAMVIVPFYDERMDAICRKYNYQFPHLKDSEHSGGDYTQQAFNRYLKDVMHQLAESVPSLNEELPTILTAGERRSEEHYREEHDGKDLYKRDERGNVLRPKWDVITGHSARRSGVTQLYETGVLSNREIMGISGHASETIFEGYIRTGKEIAAMSICDKLKKGRK